MNGCLPELEYDGHKIGQSMAIARFLAREFGLVGKSNLEAAQMDAIIDLGIDMMEGTKNGLDNFQYALYCSKEYFSWHEVSPREGRGEKG